MSENMKVNEMNLEEVTGGHDGSERYGYTYGTVHDVVMYDSTACLTLRDAPDGNVIFTDAGRAVGWQNGDSIQQNRKLDHGRQGRIQRMGQYKLRMVLIIRISF